MFFGTSVVSGTGTALARATGPRTVFGDIARRLSMRAPESEFERGLRHFSGLILTTTITLVLFILMVSVALRHDPFESLLFAVALGVGLTPEFLPLIASVTLATGALRMAREQVIVKHLPAIQNLGSIDIFCSDKTGTLTSGVMQFDRAFDAAGDPSDRALTLALLNSRFETGIRSPFDTAILQRNGAEATKADDYEKTDEIPFDFERRRVSVVLGRRGRAADDQRLLITKGAPEAVLQQSKQCEINGRAVPLDASIRRASEALCAQLGGSGFRVLAVAYRAVPPRERYSHDDETDLVLAGFLSFADPILPDVAETLEDLKNDGVSVKILTGDHDVVARHVCEQLGLSTDGVVTGDLIERLDDATLSHVVEESSAESRANRDRRCDRADWDRAAGDAVRADPGLHRSV